MDKVKFDKKDYFLGPDSQIYDAKNKLMSTAEIVKLGFRSKQQFYFLLSKLITKTNKVEYYEREINELKNKIANLEDAMKGRDYFHDHDYQYLIEENRKLERERNELLTDNKRLSGNCSNSLPAIHSFSICSVFSSD